jgi:hypothetical protein
MSSPGDQPEVTATVEPGRRPAAGPATGPVRPPIGLGTPDDDDWPKLATDRLVHAVDIVRDNTTTRAIGAANVVKYGIPAAILLTMLMVILMVAVIRGMEAILIAFGLPDPVWIPYLAFGVTFTALGVYCWRRGDRPRPAR